MKNSKPGNSIAPWTLFLFYMAMFYMQYKGREKAAKVVEFVAKWLNLCLSTVSVIITLLKRQNNDFTITKNQNGIEEEKRTVT